MSTLIPTTLALAAVVVLLVWLPGWLALGRPLRPLRILYPCLVGVALHMLALVIAGALVSSVTAAAWVVPVITLALALGLRLTFARRPLPWTAMADWAVLDTGSAWLVVALVAAAAVLRMLHNFHYDDLQHLLYLTELRRQDRLFPTQFLLRVTNLVLPQLGPGTVVLSRYPYWAVSYSVLGLIAGVPAGDAYLLLGLGVLALTLGLMVALVTQAWGRRTGRFWVVALLATSPFTSDNLLNYGGYPFQIGKLFVLLAATALVVSWRTRVRGPLLIVGACLFVGPLFHTNNIIGSAWVGLLISAMFVVVPPLRWPVARVLSAYLLLGCAGGLSLLSHGFLRWVPASELAAYQASVGEPAAEGQPATSRESAPTPAAVQPGEPIQPVEAPFRSESIFARLQLFLNRGVPSEVLVLLIAIILAPFFRDWQRVGERLAPYAVWAASVLLVATCAADAGRLLVTAPLKPGYWAMRGTLRAMTASLPPGIPIVTDPVTDIFGRAAGWAVPQPLVQEDAEQWPYLFLFHPETQGAAFDAALAVFGPSVIIVNEFVTGPEASSKFEARALPVVARAGRRVESGASIDAQLAEVAAAVGRRDPSAVGPAARLLRTALVGLVQPRQIQAFRSSAPVAPVEMDELGASVRDGFHGSLTVEPFLNSSVVTVPATDACVRDLDLTWVNQSSFDAPLFVRPLDDVPLAVARGHLEPNPEPTTMTLSLDEERCSVGPISLFVNAGVWWDARFRVTGATWRPAPSPSGS